MLLLTLLLGCPPTEKDDTGGADTADTADSGDVTYQQYACGWEKRDPGTLVSTGREVGDVLADLTLTDQCGESFRVWDMFGEYFILYFTAAW